MDEKGIICRHCRQMADYNISANFIVFCPHCKRPAMIRSDRKLFTEKREKQMNYKEIRAVYTDDTIRVYQAYRPEIALEAMRLGKFGPHFGMNRMTWIKPSFLWMMYRCGWAEKEGQEYVLAIDIRREGFDFIVNNAVASTYKPELGLDAEEWKKLIKNSDIRVQWDPERDISGNPLPYRSIQLGLRGDAVYRYVNEWTENITNITDYVKELNRLKKAGEDITERLPTERIYRLWEG